MRDRVKSRTFVCHEHPHLIGPANADAIFTTTKTGKGPFQVPDADQKSNRDDQIRLFSTEAVLFGCSFAQSFT